MISNLPPGRRIALVTGANKGIGHETAAQLAALGMTVLLAARDLGRGEQAAAALRSAGGDVHALRLDVTDPATAHAACEHIDDQFGRLDVLVNNAGRTAPRALSTASLTDVRAVFEANVFGVVTVTNAMLPLLKRSPAARIVNVSSSVGSLARISDPTGPYGRIPPSAAYGPSKTAVNALTVQYANELRGANILINAVDPGPTATDMTSSLGYRLERAPAEAAGIVVQWATVGSGGPNGGFFDDQGPVPW